MLEPIQQPMQNYNTTALFTLAPHSSSNAKWYLDNGASAHITPNIDNLYHPTTYQGSDDVLVGNDNSIPINDISIMVEKDKFT